MCSTARFRLGYRRALRCYLQGRSGIHQYFRLKSGRMDCTHVLDGNDLARSPVNGFVHLSKAPAYVV
jgi:hypothetical protein